ncbi:hypothetical protein Acid345_3640 [Candidatus Koribacter versatilis Ellin345]|uniref:Uncharacterized protein n=2 Tax=Candidatus Korobacter versatilis TaxID=658062 RepID=Q1IKF9_KORVE|nr:hypothetical protein Acid345_3640 [Candidatus Koribacter versatilis Ellin345]
MENLGAFARRWVRRLFLALVGGTIITSLFYAARFIKVGFSVKLFGDAWDWAHALSSATNLEWLELYRHGLLYLATFNTLLYGFWIVVLFAANDVRTLLLRRFASNRMRRRLINFSATQGLGLALSLTPTPGGGIAAILLLPGIAAWFSSSDQESSLLGPWAWAALTLSINALVWAAFYVACDAVKRRRATA